MSDHSSSDDGDSPEAKLRVAFVLAPSVRTERDALELPSEPMAVPASIRKRGLSAVVNHLLDRKVPKDEDTMGDDESDSEDEDKLPAIPFDFLLNDKLLRLPLESAARKEGLSMEHALELTYFPARLPPKKEGAGETLPDWVTAIEYSSSRGHAKLFTGGADGIIRSFEPKDGRLQPKSTVAAHSGPIKCLASTPFGEHTLVATGSMDQTLITHTCDKKGKLELHTVYSGGHTNSVGSVALANNGHKTIMASGDWDGGLALWSVPSSLDGEANTTESTAKKRKGVTFDEGATIREVKPLQSVRAHSSNLSGLAFGHNNPNTLLTGSWDHGLKVYDVNRMDCTLALNGSRVVTSLNRCSNSDVVATGGPDHTVRLWDMRTSGNDSGNSGMDKTLKQSHKAWVSAVRWSPSDPFVLASASHDGTLKVWDIRSSLPLHTVKAVNAKGEKALCLAFGEGKMYCGGSDCVVKQFACKV
ncbi:hypothetical protein ACHAXT_007157 [Thalassiosira profunda]